MIGPGIVEAVRLPGFSLPGFGIGSSLAKDLAKAIFDGLSAWVADGAAWLVGHVAALVTSTTRIDLDAGWFLGALARMKVVALVVTAPLLAVATLGAVVRQDSRRLVRIYAVGLPVALIAGAVGTVFVNLALAAVDQMSALVDQDNISDSLRVVGHNLALHGIPAFVELLVAGLVILGSIALWFELVLRSTAIYVAVFFFPLGLAAMVWPAAATVTKRFVELLGALILSKFVIVATLTLGAAALLHADGIDAVITGAAVLVMAAFAPFVVLRLVPLAEFAVVNHLEGQARRPARVAASAGSGGGGGGLSDRAPTGPRGGLSEAPVSAAAIPTMAAGWRPGESGGSPAPGGSSPSGGPGGGPGPASGGPASGGPASGGPASGGTAAAGVGSAGGGGGGAGPAGAAGGGFAAAGAVAASAGHRATAAVHEDLGALAGSPGGDRVDAGASPVASDPVGSGATGGSWADPAPAPPERPRGGPDAVAWWTFPSGSDG